METKKVLIIILCFFIISHILTPITISHFQINMLNEPENKAYRSDELSFLKTFYLMKKGQGYYQAFRQARENLAISDRLNADTFTWRMPVSFYMWYAFANSGQQILTLFIFLCSCLLFSVYLILRKILSHWLAAAGPVLLLPYLYDTLRYKTAFLFTEWWGLIFFIFGLTLYFYKKNNFAILFLLLAVAAREHFMIPLLFLLVIFWIRKESWKIFLITMILGSIIVFIHSLNIRNLIGGLVDFKIFERLHPYSFPDLQRMVSFSMRGYVFLGLKSHYLVLALGGLGLLGGLGKKEGVYLLAVILSFIGVLPFISVYDNDYWGIMFVPFIIFSIPLLVSHPWGGMFKR